MIAVLIFMAISCVQYIDDLTFSVTYLLSYFQSIWNDKKIVKQLAEECYLDQLVIVRW